MYYRMIQMQRDPVIWPTIGSILMLILFVLAFAFCIMGAIVQGTYEITRDYVRNKYNSLMGNW